MSKHKYLPYLMWLFPLLFFAYQFILRLWPSLMMNQIMHQFAIDASSFGLLAAFYYYGYAGMQIPVAMLLDRFKARYVIFGCAVLCGCSVIIFTTTENWYLACLSRFLVGAGSAVGFLGASKVISQWFPKSQYAKMIGLTFTFGLMGAIFGGKPVSLLVDYYSWQKVAFTIALVSIAIGVSVYIFLRTPNHNTESENSGFKLSDLKSLVVSPLVWIIAIANMLMVGSLEGFADVWGVPYLMTAYGLNKGSAAELVSFIFFGMLFGGPLLAVISVRFGNYSVLTICGMGMAAIVMVLLSGTLNNWYAFAFLFFTLGILCCYQVIVFAAGSELVPNHLLGVTVAFLNCINMLGGSFFHSTIGYLMDIYWTGLMDQEGIRTYTMASYEKALLMIPICAVLGSGLIAYAKLRVSRSSRSGKLIYGEE